METFKLNDICKQLIGKTLVSLQFGSEPTEELAEENGERYVPKNSIIEDAMISTTEGDRDPCIRLVLKDAVEVEVYDNETITLS